MSAPATAGHRHTVGIRLQGPMQSWANAARGAIRPTHTRPTKAGVIGLIANALGRDFADSIDDLAGLRFGVRVDEPGRLETDYHTTGSGQYYVLPRELAYAPSWWGDTRDGANPADPNWMTYAPTRDIGESKSGAASASLASGKANSNITTDQYLADASFLAAVQTSDKDLAVSIAAALAAPARAIFLGRKALGPASPLLEALTTTSIEELFEATAGPALARSAADPVRGGLVQVYVEPEPGGDGVVVYDQPISFSGPTRRAARLEAQYWLGQWRSPAVDHGGPSAAIDAANIDADSVFDTIFSEGQVK
ncbi:CRISPR-associated protein Cas5 [Mycobacteroides abscessus]|uniref:CRISPR-associated protein Cas5 n=1 Tax=Mycobacteroides abscessus TaxID=36809 RepID=UPI00130004A4|nr:CRISPR-associated protein Cas5 [Mycobacteroides abscessus]